jgi:hypothetical protein
MSESGTVEMLDKDTALAAADAISTAMAAMIEDCHDAAVSAAADLPDYLGRAEDLKGVANDMIVLVAAVIVLARRCSE